MRRYATSAHSLVFCFRGLTWWAGPLSNYTSGPPQIGHSFSRHPHPCLPPVCRRNLTNRKLAGGGRRVEARGKGGTPPPGRPGRQPELPMSRSTPPSGALDVPLRFADSVARPPPDPFGDELEIWIYKQHVGSVVSIEFRPDSNMVLERWNSVAPVDQETPVSQKRLEESTLSVFSTGSVIGEDTEGRLLILTTAHVLGPAFNAEMPITADEIEQLFQPFVLCDHRETRFRRGEDLERIRSYATVAEISCTNDLLLLKIAKGRLMHYCNEVHKPVLFSSRSARALRRVVMLSWPYLRNRTVVQGHVSHRGRNMAEISDENPYGLTTRMAEVDITSQSGSSGAPLFDGWGNCVGMLHGGDGVFSYVIPLRAIRETLEQWGVGKFADE